MTLYFIRGSTQDGYDNMDLFAVADTPSEAAQMWNEYYEGWGVEREVLVIALPPHFKQNQGPIPWDELVQHETRHTVKPPEDANG